MALHALQGCQKVQKVRLDEFLHDAPDPAATAMITAEEAGRLCILMSRV